MARCMRLCLILSGTWLWCGDSTPVFGGEPFRALLSSVRHSIGGESYRVSSDDVTPDCPHAWSVTQRTLHGGKQEGTRIVEIHNGRMTIVVIPTRGMGIYDVRLDDVRLGWVSPVQEIVNPSFVNLESRNGLGWLEGFNEWMVRCGMEFAGGPGPDEFINNVGDKASMNLTLHGKVANIPASEVELIVDRDPPYRIRVRGVVREHLLHGPKLTLVAEVSTEPGSASLRIEDQVTNESGSPQELQLIYHTNYGRPLLEGGAKFVTPSRRVAPMNSVSAAAVDTYDTYSEPQAGFVEQVFLIEPYADANGQTQVLLKNKAGDRGSTIRWSTAELPYLTVWKNTTAESDGYVTGLEPGTGYPFNRSVERKAGRVPKLAPGETRPFALEFAIQVGRDEVAAEEAWIRKVQDNRPVDQQRDPPDPNG